MSENKIISTSDLLYMLERIRASNGVFTTFQDTEEEQCCRWLAADDLIELSYESEFGDMCQWRLKGN